MELTAIKGGINRLRVKGKARADSLYDLVNGYVTAARTIKRRPGTKRRDTLTTGTVGLTSFNEKLHVFSTTAVGGLPADYVLNIIKHPEDTALTLSEIHFAKPFLGFLYVAAEFSNGDVYHYWLQDATTWQANKVYQANELASPSVPAGFVFRATRLGAALPAWTPGTKRLVGDRIEPTDYSGFYAEVVEVNGSNPRSGAAEPDWPTEAGAFVVEEIDGEGTGASSPQPPSPPAPNDPFVGGGGGGRYTPPQDPK